MVLPVSGQLTVIVNNFVPESSIPPEETMSPEVPSLFTLATLTILVKTPILEQGELVERALVQLETVPGKQ